jgi:molybdenum cofactor synthesis domain-containing protein
MKKINTADAVGAVLCHDITQIVPGKFKGPAFKKGHIIREEDIPVLLSLGKEHIFIWEHKEGTLHENDAALRLKELTAGEGLEFSELKEGKIDFIAKHDGLLKIDTSQLLKLNLLGEIILSTLHNNTPVRKGQKVAGTRITPLVIHEEKIIKAEQLITDKVVNVYKIKPKKTAIITTGSEVFHGRIKDAFGPVIIKKLEEYNCEVMGQTFLPDDENLITDAIKEWLKKGAEMVVCSGGMSVDPDDVTPSAIKNTGSCIVTYGAPVLPGAMFLMAYSGDVPIMGLPGCVMYSKRTIFDLVLPRVLINEKLTPEDIASLGHGGLCLDCEICTYPNCSFGKY